MNDSLAPISYAVKIGCCPLAMLPNFSPILTSLLILLVYEHLLVPLEYEIPCTKELFTK